MTQNDEHFVKRAGGHAVGLLICRLRIDGHSKGQVKRRLTRFPRFMTATALAIWSTHLVLRVIGRSLRMDFCGRRLLVRNEEAVTVSVAGTRCRVLLEVVMTARPGREHALN